MKVFLAAMAVFFLDVGMTIASEADETVSFDVAKMTCAACPIAVRKAMQRVDGVKEVVVNLEGRSAVVTFDASKTTAEEIGRASTDIGFPATARGTK